MTSPLRRKRPTTLPNTPPETASNPSTDRSGDGTAGFERRLPIAALLAVAALLSPAAPRDAAAATELQWRRGRAPSAQQQGVSRAYAAPRHRDAAVRPASYGEEAVDGPSFATHQSGAASLRSIVVPRDDSRSPNESPRPGKLAWQQREPDSRYEEGIRTPFGDRPADDDPDDLFGELDQPAEEDLPPLPPEEPPVEMDDDLALPEETEQQPPPRQPTGPPRTFQPQPPAQPPRARDGIDPFESERLPRRREADDIPDVDASILAAEEERAQADCSAELSKLKASTLHDVELSIVVVGDEGTDYPWECTIDDGSWHPGRHWCETTYMWKASALCHKPLYFEDESLERYGHSWGPYADPLVSGAHFFTRLAVLPYCMGVQAPNECVYALGHYRPGNCAPYMISPVPIASCGEILQAGAVVGVVLLIP